MFSLVKYFVVLSVLMSVFGCASTRSLQELPIADEEFVQPLDSLKEVYPDIEIYSTAWPLLGYCTPIESIMDKWGEPAEIQTVWFQVPLVAVPIAFAGGGVTGGVVGTGIAYGMFPKQPKHYIWEKPGYRIEATVSTDIFCGYEPRLRLWKWEAYEKP